MDLAERTFQFITSHGLIRKGATWLVGVSGGPDSVALLDVLYRIRLKLGVNLQVGHFNHCLRPNAHKDEAFVKALAKNLGLACHVQRRNISSGRGLVSEDAARQWRMIFFVKIAKKIRADGVILAHTQNDLAETVLMRLIRGAGLSGLRGILTQHRKEEINFIRPFLSVSRKEIEKYIKAQKLKFCVDETNQQTHYLRNKIRLQLLPDLINKYNSNLPEVLVDLAHTSQADYEYLYSQAQLLFKTNAKKSALSVRIKLKVFLKQQVAIKRMLLRLSFEYLVGDLNQVSFKHIQEVEDLLNNRPAGSEVHWPKAVIVLKTKDSVMLKYSVS